MFLLGYTADEKAMSFLKEEVSKLDSKEIKQMYTLAAKFIKD